MIIRCRAPLRLGLAGGGTDVSPFSDIYGGCVLNATIDRYVYATLEDRGDEKLIFEAGDIHITDRPEYGASLPLDSGLKLHRAVYNHFISTYNDGKPMPLYVHTLAEAPAGSGLGTSSTLAVALCAVFADYFRVSMDEYELAQLAWRIERKDCGFAGGKQDQYAAAFGGVNFMEFMTDGRVLVNPLRIKRKTMNEFESSLLLYFTGVSRDSEKIIKTQSENTSKKDEAAIQAMRELKEEAYAMKASLLMGDFSRLIMSFHKGWESKKRMAKEISNSSIEELYNAALEAGAEAAKISGAGGGGFMMFIVPPAKRSAVLDILLEKKGEMFPAHFTQEGVEVWHR